MNPYEILGLDHRATRAEIVGAVARALRLRRHSAHEIARAQRALLDPVTRAAHEFLHFLDVELLSGAPRRRRAPRGQAPLPLLEPLGLVGGDHEAGCRR
jgi:hypothetical protein